MKSFARYCGAIIPFCAGVLVLIAFLSLSGCEREHQDGADSLIRSFAAGCSSQGEWTQAALAQTRALAMTIQSLQNNDKCKGVSYALSSVQSLASEIERLQTDPLVVNEKNAQETKRQILLELSTASDPLLISDLTSALAQAEVQLAQAQAMAATSRDEEGNSSMVRGLNQMSGYLTTLLSGKTALQACADDYPELGLQIGSGVLAIAGTFVNPAMGSAMSAAGQMLSSVVDFARRKNLQNQLGNVESVEMQAALACGLESMADTYCKAQDMYKLAKLQADSYPEQWKPTSFWAGLDLWSREVPHLMEWVTKLATGVIGDEAGAGRQNEAWQKVHSLQSAERSVEGFIAFTERVLANPPQPTGNPPVNWQEKTIRNAMTRLLNLMYGDPAHGYSASPIAEYYASRTTLLYRIAGIPLGNCVPNSSNGSCANEDTITLPPGGFVTISENTRQVFKEVSDQLLANLHLIIDIDPSGLLKEALQPSRVGRRAPLDVTRDLILFLDESAKYFDGLNTPESKQMVVLIRDTQALLADMASAVMTAPGNAQGDRLVVKDLFLKLNLIYGSDFLSGRIYRHIKWDLTSRIDHGQAPEDIEEILRASGRDAARELTGVSRGGLDELNQDISTSQAVSQQNVESFVTLFQDGLAGAIQRLKEAADRAGEPIVGPHRPNRMLQARLCILMLTTSSEWPRDVDAKICSGAVVESIYPGFKEKLTFDELAEKLRGKPLEERMCTYQHFLRRSRLFGN